MFWYSSKSTSVAALICWLVLLAGSSGCNPGIKANSSLKYFDLKKYLSADIARLQKIDKPVTKTVSHNGTAETKKVHIDNWTRELGLFTDADINKPAWKSSYTVTDDDGILLYRAKEPELTVRELLIKKNKQKVKWILIFTKNQNMLYKTTRKLTYFPDSMYMIEMVQRVRFLGTNVYKIKGLITQ